MVLLLDIRVIGKDDRVHLACAGASHKGQEHKGLDAAQFHPAARHALSATLGLAPTTKLQVTGKSGFPDWLVWNKQGPGTQFY